MLKKMKKNRIIEPIFEKKDALIRERYIDENGKIQTREKNVAFPTGKVLNAPKSKTKADK